MAHFHCDRCNHEQFLEDDFVGRMARCPDCQQVGRVSAGDGNAAKNLSILQSLTAGWRGVVILCGSGLLSFLAVWMWANEPPADRHSLIADSVALGLEHPTSALKLHARSGSIPTTAVENSPADALFPEGQNPLPSVVMNSQGADPERPAVVDAASVAANPQPLVTILETSSVVRRSSPSDETAEVAPPTKQIAVSKAAVTEPPISRPKTAVATGTEPSHDEQQQHLAARSEGQQLFEHEWTVQDSLAGKGDGLGPVFNAKSCAQCHFLGGIGGSGPNGHNVQSFEILPSQNGGTLQHGIIHASATSLDQHESKKQLEAFLGSPKVPFRRIDRKKNEIVQIDAIRTVLMNTPALWGNGLVDKITLKDLERLEYTHPSTGRFRHLSDGKIGKFGWKAQVASLHQFVGTACATEMGLSNSVRSQQKPMEYRDDYSASHDLNDNQLKSLTQFVADLPAPRQVIPESPEGKKEVAAGERLFASIGCANCHAKDVGVAHGVYSDFRLHNISSAVTKVETYYVIDAVPIYLPEANAPRLSEWKTPPLWGVADTAPYWHDGSAPTLREAILKHEGEAGIVKAEFETMTSEQQNRLLAFLDTLKAPVAGPSSDAQAVAR